MHGRWDPVNDAIEAALRGISLADMERALPRMLREAAAQGLAPSLQSSALHASAGTDSPADAVSAIAAL
jgi:hypothetical protein